MKVFQSTPHARGATQLRTAVANHLIHFNPRSREGSDLCKFIRYACQKAISIHAPARGATGFSTATQISDLISIHAPARGATGTHPSYFWSDFEFQSTLPRGERQSRNLTLTATAGFQSTPPRGERLPMLRFAQRICNFNPRSREGSDFTTNRAA